MPIVRFDDEYADARPHQVQAYAEIGSEDGRARALVLVYARRDAVHPGKVLVGVRLVAMQLKTGRQNAGANWSTSVVARSSVARHVGAEHSHYISNQALGEGRSPRRHNRGVTALRPA